MAKYNVKIEDGCISCGNCEAICPEIFEVKEKAEVKKSELDDAGCAQEAADSCPVNVIKIKEVED